MKTINDFKIQDLGKIDNLELIDSGVINNAPIPLAKLKEMIKNNEDVTKVNTSQITDMSGLFSGMENFNQDISGWDVSIIRYMGLMFVYTESFNQPLEKWNVSNVTDMSYMFESSPMNPLPIWYKK